MRSYGAGVFTKCVACFGALAVCVGLCPSAAAEPTLTECIGAREIVDGTTIEFYDCDLVVDGPPQGACDAQAVLSDFWLSYTFTVDGTATLYLSGVEYIEVYGGTCGALGDVLACSAGSSVSFDGPVGATRLIRAGYFSGDCGGTLGVVISSPGRALPTSFTYQGRLSDGGLPTNGVVDMQFRLFDFYSGGVQVGPVVFRPGVSVSDGYLTTLLDFGAGVCDGRDRWLEIMVNGETLSPRQELTATPYALYALNAGSASYAVNAGSAATAVHADNGGSGGVFIESFSRPSMGDVGYNSNPNAFVPVVQTDKVVSLPAGKAVFDWTLPGMSTGSGKTVQLRANVAGVLGPAITYKFGDAFTELPMSGHVVVTIPQAVTGTVCLEVKVTFPSGGALWYPGVGAPNGGVNGSGTGMTWTLVVYKD